jgi:hypothetical protein
MPLQSFPAWFGYALGFAALALRSCKACGIAGFDGMQNP